MSALVTLLPQADRPLSTRTSRWTRQACPFRRDRRASVGDRQPAGNGGAPRLVPCAGPGASPSRTGSRADLVRLGRFRRYGGPHGRRGHRRLRRGALPIRGAKRRRPLRTEPSARPSQLPAARASCPPSGVDVRSHQNACHRRSRAHGPTCLGVARPDGRVSAHGSWGREHLVDLADRPTRCRPAADHIPATANDG